MMYSAERDRELVARLASQRARLHEAKMVWIGRLAAADQAGLLCDMTEVRLVTVAARRANRENSFVDTWGLMELGIHLFLSILCPPYDRRYIDETTI
jgi:hypothetical protein